MIEVGAAEIPDDELLEASVRRDPHREILD
jgi:hypothetical protein